MTSVTRLLLIIVAVLGVSLVTVTAAQTPLPNTSPNLTIKWLSTLGLSPTSVSAGGQITGTVRLLRNAVSDLRVGLNLVGAQPVEGGIWTLNGVVMPDAVTVKAGTSQATFIIATSSSVTWTGTKSFTVNANYGSEKLSAGFSVSRLATKR